MMKAIFFDASGVLYYRPDKYRSIRAFLQRQHLPVPCHKKVKKAVKRTRRDASIGAVSCEAYHDAVLEAWGAGAPALREPGRRAVAAAQWDLRLYPGVVETLRALRERGFCLGVVTDTVIDTPQARQRLIDRGLDIAWDAFVSSVDVRAQKPDPRMYQAALAQCEVAPCAAVFVGHNQEELDGARALGMTTVAARYRCPHKPVKGDYAIQAFADLLTLPWAVQASPPAPAR